jgi:hypothetical protein
VETLTTKAAVKAVEKKQDSLNLLTNLMEDANSAIYRNLVDSLAKRPNALVWELTGYFCLSPDFCLSVFDLLKNQRDSSTRLVVKVNCSLVDASLLFMCAADEIRLSAGRSFRLRSLDCFKAMIGRSKGIESFQGEQQESVAAFEYEQCLQILDEYLPVKQLADKLLPMETLKEFGLGLPLDQELAFQKLFTADFAKT